MENYIEVTRPATQWFPGGPGCKSLREGYLSSCLAARAPGALYLCTMISEMRERLGREVEELSHELNVKIPQAIAQAVELGDLRENSEYKAALERQQFVQARLGQLHERLRQLNELTQHSPADRVGLGSTVTVEDLGNGEMETYVVVLGEMADFDLGHVSVASPIGRALKDRTVGDEVELRLPTMIRRLRIRKLVTAQGATLPAN